MPAGGGQSLGPQRYVPLSGLLRCSTGVEFFLEAAPAFFGFGKLGGERSDLVVQTQGVGGVGGLHKLLVRLAFLIVQSSDGSFERRHLLADFSFGTAGNGGGQSLVF